MAIRIGILADIHLPDVTPSAQEAALDWALHHLAAERTDVVIVAGDVTAAGTVEAAGRARAKMDGSGLTYRMMAGNSDRRTPGQEEPTRDLLTASDAFADDQWVAICLDSSEETIPPTARAGLQRDLQAARDRRVVLVTHYPPDTLPDDDREWLHRVLAGGRVGLFIAGHSHVDRQESIGLADCHIVRGLDPDKAIGGPPALAIFELADGTCSRRDVSFPDGDVGVWSPDAREEFLARLGFSCMADSLDGLAAARERAVTCVELRAAYAAETPGRALRDAVRAWRDAGGEYLSVHMPDLIWDRADRAVGGTGEWDAALDLAMDLGAQALTIHVPRASVGEMRPGLAAWDAFAEHLLASVAPAIEMGVVLSIENLHMNAGEPADEGRRFGYLPDECLAWIRHLRETAGYKRIGMHLDIGHARNNVPFSNTLTVGQWYAFVGAEVTGYHLHQVETGPEGMSNHAPIESVFGPTVSLSSFFWGWHTGQLRHAPMFLEIRAPWTGWDSLDRIRAHFRDAGPCPVQPGG